MCDWKRDFCTHSDVSSHCLVCHNSLWLCPDYLCWLNRHQCVRLRRVLLLIITSHREMAFQVLLMPLMSLSELFRLLSIWFVVRASQNRELFMDSTALQEWFTHLGGCIYLFIYSWIHFAHVCKGNNNSVFVAVHTYICSNPYIEAWKSISSRLMLMFSGCIY